MMSRRGHVCDHKQLDDVITGQLTEPRTRTGVTRKNSAKEAQTILRVRCQRREWWLASRCLNHVTHISRENTCRRHGWVRTRALARAIRI